MPTATLPQLWRGRSGREYVPTEGSRIRHGGMAIVRKVTGRGGPVGTSTPEDGVALALKQWTEADDASLDQLQAEARVLVEVSAHPGELPCPRLYDLVGAPLVTGIVMEWCPADLERWWRDKLKEPDSFGRLMATLAEVARRVSDYHVFYAQNKGMEAAHGDLKPSNVLLSVDARWLISDFGAARVKPPDDNPLVTSKVVAGTENFLSPEALFHAKKRFPAAMDTWALGATAFALLRLRRLTLDNSQVPRNGTSSPRFRMARINQIHEVYGHNPTRFHDRDMDPEAFPDPLRLPEEDRRSIVDSIRGVFGGVEDLKREDVLSRELLDVLDRTLSIDPRHRFTDARDLAAAFERITRVYLELSNEGKPGGDATEVLVRGRDEAEQRALLLEEELEATRERLTELLDRLPTEEAPRDLAVQTVIQREIVNVAPPGWWSFALVLVLMLQGLTLLMIGVGLALLGLWHR